MSLHFEDHGLVLIARARDAEIGADNAPDLRLQMMKHVQPEHYLAVDLSPVTFMDSSGLSFLVALLKRVRDIGACRVFGVQPRVLELFRLTRLDKVFTIDPNEETAVAMLEESARRSKSA
ncbi:MAG: STAS domain-containing protein [Candidatus Eisenbacteria bacterium]|uniref:STAS domain-containing protein n=1 Tax=Eiseniibacteriota bacterium TaxID=2212470 RepID=A0A948W2J0_UNCEI|nr:STAS domain-containing protein [Candidatus Eisenbacteria bacterium]MBU1949916.1 STAS domain-containing protein [Candidatus Eisenbacteria bacterium]MBU2690007.1 STAS domain-containing protein [Candidatus Eisenbacteria bacterium]